MKPGSQVSCLLQCGYKQISFLDAQSMIPLLAFRTNFLGFDWPSMSPHQKTRVENSTDNRLLRISSPEILSFSDISAYRGLSNLSPIFGAGGGGAEKLVSHSHIPLSRYKRREGMNSGILWRTHYISDIPSVIYDMEDAQLFHHTLKET
ncbi:hypothetical protein L873DRAFT_743197 [Choiromyces venosus 120613-1]|uniref:CHASE domain-containing protein n=1 Tax=Choiromyces venosus 120613-1 TaxID=1336337 RepID=A0A3N4JUE2_9PEZI|nr:hypothetical protein L873DRAFT_743197 [Choiromyces venosus 120613-1]